MPDDLRNGSISVGEIYFENIRAIQMFYKPATLPQRCLLYTSDAADD